MTHPTAACTDHYVHVRRRIGDVVLLPAVFIGRADVEFRNVEAETFVRGVMPVGLLRGGDEFILGVEATPAEFWIATVETTKFLSMIFAPDCDSIIPPIYRARIDDLYHEHVRRRAELDRILRRHHRDAGDTTTAANNLEGNQT